MIWSPHMNSNADLSSGPYRIRWLIRGYELSYNGAGSLELLNREIETMSGAKALAEHHAIMLATGSAKE